MKIKAPGRIAAAFGTGLATVAVLLSPVSGAFSAKADGPARVTDGTSAANAAASCWEAKQTNPDAKDGVYWLQTPSLVAPQQFYCDMTTDGGGWVLIARGREGWLPYSEGNGSAATLRNTPSGTGAFQSITLPNDTVDGLLNGSNVKDLADGIRLRRASSADGSQNQEIRYHLHDGKQWTWAIAAPQWMDGWSITDADGSVHSGSGGWSNNFGTDNGLDRVVTTKNSGQGYNIGFEFGGSVTGSNNSSSYLWSTNNGQGNAYGFTQMFIRPKTTQADLKYTALPDAGQTVAAKSQADGQSNFSLPATWGVTGLANGQGNESSPEVAAFAQIGNTMFVGGNFTTVLKNGDQSTAHAQKFLAAFDVNTGEYLPQFAPVLDGQVKSLAALPNGTLAVGGEFRNVNGVANASLVTLDPTTGATNNPMNLHVERRMSSGLNTVRSMKVSGNYLYIGGNFTHVAGGTRVTNPVYAQGAARIDLTTGTADANWNPNFNATVYSVEVDPDYGRMYAAGYFTTEQGKPQASAAAVSVASGAANIPWTLKFSSSNHYQQTVITSGNNVFVGGSEHSLFTYDRATLTFQHGLISMAGGDFQCATKRNGLVYMGNHGDDYVYDGQTYYGYPNGPSTYQATYKISLQASVHDSDGTYNRNFDPRLEARQGLGAWAMTFDTNNTYWTGGSFTSSVNTNGKKEWVGGFARFAALDTTADPAPTNLGWTQHGDGSGQLTWSAPQAGETFEVLAGDRVVATTKDLSYALPMGAAGTKYAVRSIDASGNRSESTPVLDQPTVKEATTVDLISTGAQWSYAYDGTQPEAAWNTAQATQQWATGASPLGYGSATLGTTLAPAAGATKPVTAYFRTNFTVADPSTMDKVVFTARADDGVAIYVNGVEAKRVNLPATALTVNTYATAAPRTTAATQPANLVTFEVPGSALVAGANVVAAETHVNYRNTPDMSFDLTAKGYSH